jgi:ZIP family zinc transporter
MLIILYSMIAGTIGMGLGGVIAAAFGRGSARTSSIFLAFAAGVMTSIVFEALIPEANHLAGPGAVFLGLALGIGLFLLLGYIVDWVSSGRFGERVPVHETPDELFHETDFIDRNHETSLFRAGVLMFIAIGLHNVPEGVAIGAGGIANEHLGVMLAIMIALHNIPEGMAIAGPLVGGGVSRTKAVVLTFLAGATTVVGALIGVVIGAISDFMIGLALSIAAGAMLYAVFGEIMPQTILLRKDRITTATLILGIFVGLLIALIL